MLKIALTKVFTSVADAETILYKKRYPFDVTFFPISSASSSHRMALVSTITTAFGWRVWVKLGWITALVNKRMLIVKKKSLKIYPRMYFYFEITSLWYFIIDIVSRSKNNSRQKYIYLFTSICEVLAGWLSIICWWSEYLNHFVGTFSGNWSKLRRDFWEIFLYPRTQVS